MQPWPSVSRGKPFLRAGRAGEPHSSRPAARSHAAWSRCEDARVAAAPQVGSDLVPAAGPAAARPDCPAPGRGQGPPFRGGGRDRRLWPSERPRLPPAGPATTALPRRLFVSCFYLFNLRRSVCRRRKPRRQWFGYPSWGSPAGRQLRDREGRVPHAAAQPQVPGPVPGPADVRGVSEGVPRMQSRPDPEMGCSPHASSSRKPGCSGEWASLQCRPRTRGGLQGVHGLRS